VGKEKIEKKWSRESLKKKEKTQTNHWHSDLLRKGEAAWEDDNAENIFKYEQVRKQRKGEGGGRSSLNSRE